MLNRKAYQKLLHWKKLSNKQALMVTGARQVGKTYLIRAFLREHFEDYVEINLIENTQALDAFDAAQDAADLMLVIEALAQRKLTPGKTAIFIDEVQKCKDIVTMLKFLVDKNDYRFVVSGSLLGVELVHLRSIPVGYLYSVEMFPLDFEEFCHANGVTDEVYHTIKEGFDTRKPLADFYHQYFMSLFYKYLIVGGMPDAVSNFIEHKSIPVVREIQQNIRALYKKDISQYNPKRALQIMAIYDLMPSELNQQNKRFRLNSLKERATISRYENDFVWLSDAGVALPCYVLDEPKYPLLLSKKSRLFKLYSSDIGLLTSCFFPETAIDILGKNLNINYGSIYENAVAQELKTHGFDLYYYNGKKHGELDFVLESRAGTILPIEVKSGKDYRRHRALSNVLEVKDYNIQAGYVLCGDNLHVADKITYLPIYMTSCITPDL